MRKLEVGDKLWFVPAEGMERGNPQRAVEVIKVARKYAYLDRGNERIHLDNWAMDGRYYSSPGRCYGSVNEYYEERHARMAMSALRQAIEYTAQPIESPSIETIQHCADMLQLGEEFKRSFDRIRERKAKQS